MDEIAKGDSETSITAYRMIIDQTIESIQNRTASDEPAVYAYAVQLCQKIIRHYESQDNIGNMLLREHFIQDAKNQLEMLNTVHNKFIAR